MVTQSKAKAVAPMPDEIADEMPPAALAEAEKQDKAEQDALNRELNRAYRLRRRAHDENDSQAYEDATDRIHELAGADHVIGDFLAVLQDGSSVRTMNGQSTSIHGVPVLSMHESIQAAG